VLIVSFYQAGAQQIINYTQYFLNAPIINPAYTGIEDYWEVKAGLKQPWNTFDESVNSTFIGLYGFFAKKSPLTFKENSPRISNPDLFETRTVSNKQFLRKHGVGLFLISNENGPFKEQIVMPSYALHIPISTSYRLTLGTSFGLFNREIDFDDLSVRDPDNDQFFQELISQDGSKLFFNLRLGGVLYSEKFHIGISAFPVVQNSLDNETATTTEEQETSFTLMSGFKISLGPKFQLLPGVLLVKSKNLPIEYTVNSRIKYREKMTLGLSFNNERSASIVLGLWFKNQIQIGYSYDYLFSELNNLNQGVHELILSIAIKKRDFNQRMW